MSTSDFTLNLQSGGKSIKVYPYEDTVFFKMIQWKDGREFYFILNLQQLKVLRDNFKELSSAMEKAEKELAEKEEKQQPPKRVKSKFVLFLS